MLGVLNHPRLVYDWFTTTLLRWSDDGLVIYERWVIGSDGVGAWSGSGGEVLLDFYYLCYLIAFIGVLVLFTRYRRKGWLQIKPHVPYDTLLLAMIGVLVGAKTAYIFIYNPDFYFGPPPYGPVDTADQLRRIFLNWSGMASHGAAAGVLTMALIWRIKAGKKLPIAQIGDVGAIASAFGAAWIRLANFMNGELYGRVASDSVPWAMRFPVRSGKGNAVVFQNGELYERMSAPADESKREAWLEGLRQINPEGVIETSNGVLFKNPDAYHQSFELALPTADGVVYSAPDPDRTYIGLVEIVTTPRHPSQLYQLLLEGVLVFVFLLWLRKRVKRAGMVASAFFIAYPVARFIGEFFRQPDVQFESSESSIGTIFMGLSMGQILSMIMVCVGITMLVYFRKHGRVIADQEMYPPEKSDAEPKKKAPLSVPFEKGMGGSTGAGSIAGLSDVRAALAEKEKEWDKQAEDESMPDKQTEQADEPDNTDPDRPERGD